MSKSQDILILALTGLSLLSIAKASFPYYGSKIGALKRLHHGVSGDVYAVDSRTVFIKNFNYDGEAPAAYFYMGNTNKPSNEGAYRLRDERDSPASLTRRYRNKDITLSLPKGKTLRDFKWFSVWCDEFAVNFGDVSIPNNLDFPRPQKIAQLKGVHGVSSENVVIVDAQTLLVPNFSYDGEAPDAKFWVGRGQTPTAQGLRIPDENGKENPLRRYDRKTIVLTLPGDLTIFDIGHFGVWCEAFTVDFGHVRIPEGLNVPPSLKMLGISPQSKLNCEVLYDDLAYEVRWAVAGESIVIQLVAKLANNQYMSFGISPSKERTEMVGADVVVAWVDKETGKGFAQDYYLEGRSQCSGGRGSCPDVNIQENTNSIRLLNAAMVNGYSIVTYQRSLLATDKLDLPISVNDSEAIVWAIGPLNERNETSFHSHYNKHTHHIDFGRQPTWNCPMPEGSGNKQSSAHTDDNDSSSDTEDVEDQRNTAVDGYPPAKSDTPELEEEFYDNRAQALQRQPNRRQEASRPTQSKSQSQSLSQRQRPVPTPKPASTDGAWEIPPIQCYEPEDGVFYAQMGPTGGKHGYSAITGHVGWGISWYINGLLIPEIHVVRGKTYTFVVEGGNHTDVPAKYHPFYITDDPIGGYEHKREEEKQAVRIFAGVHRSRSGQVTPIGVGRLCNWTPDVDGPPSDDYQSFGAYQRTLTLVCEPGEPGVITWKPDRTTPDTVYYQCFTHRYLGWRIHVHDSCDDAQYAASEKHEMRVPYGHASASGSAAASAVEHESEDIDQAAASSIRHETKVSPNDNFLLKHQTDLIKNHNMNGTPPKLAFEITKSSEITKLISDGIRAAEALEESILRSKGNNMANTAQTIGQHPNRYAQQPYNSNSNNNNNNINNNNNVVIPKQPAKSLQAQQQLPHLPHLPRLPSAHGLPPIGQVPHNYISTAVPEFLQGESHHHSPYYHSPSSPSSLPPPASSASPSTQSPVLIQSSHYHHHYHHLHPHHPNNLTNFPIHSLQKPIGLSEYLRPPQNAPLFHPVKLPGRRPFPAGLVAKKVPSSSKPVLPQHLPPQRHVPGQPHIATAAASIPQPAVIVSHYRKPVPSLLKPFFKEKPFPLQPLAASVLLLGQPTELGNHRKNVEPLVKKKPHLSVPYGDLMPQDSLRSNVYVFNGKIKKDPKPGYPVMTMAMPNLINLPTAIVPDNLKSAVEIPIPASPQQVFKKPFDMHEVKDESLPPELAIMRPAVNNGFKPDSVVVESGFRPIIRREGYEPDDDDDDEIDQVAHRREDPGSEIDEAMETDTLFLTAQKETETHNFEPMFIPSPPDSTNNTIIIRKTASRPPRPRPTDESIFSSDGPVAAKLQNATLEGGSAEDTENLSALDALGDEGVTIKDSKPEENNEYYSADDVNEQRDDFLEDRNGSEDEIRISKRNEKIERERDSPKVNRLDEDLAIEEDKDFDLDENEEDHDDDDDDDKEAQAAERIDTYYLPPDNRKIPNANIPSGAVITYDGKSIVDSSLVLPPRLETRDRDPANLRSRQSYGLSKIEQLVRNTPQFRPYRGEIPPPIPDFLSAERSLRQGSGINPITTTSSSSSPSSLSSLNSAKYHSHTQSTPTLTPSARALSTKLQIFKSTA